MHFKIKRFLNLFLILFLTCSGEIKKIRAQEVTFDLIAGHYNHQHFINDEFNGIVTQMSSNPSEENLLLGFDIRYKVEPTLEFKLGFVAYTEMYESMVFWDTTEDQLFGDWVQKGWVFGGGQFTVPATINYKVILSEDFGLSFGMGLDYFFFLKKDPINEIDLGRQHPRLNDFLPRIDKAYFRNRLLPLFTIGLNYKRFSLELQTRINPEYSFSTFEFENEQFQPSYWRKVSSITLGYTFLKLRSKN